MVTDNKIVQQIGEQVKNDYEFIPIFTIISIIISTIQLLWRCSRAKNTKEGQQMIAQNYYGAEGYSRTLMTSTRRAVKLTALSKGVLLNNEQATKIAEKICDGLRTANEEELPSFDLI
jgi:hypothetical protein